MVNRQYGVVQRVDPPPVLEQQVGPIVRQIQPQRVTDVTPAFTPAISIGFSATNPFESFTDAGGELAVNWDAEHVDANGFHDNVTNNDRFTIPAGFAGQYRINARIIFNSNGNSDGTRIVRIYVNTTLVKTVTINNAGSATDTIVMADYQQFMRDADYFQVRAEITGTGTVTLQGGTADDSYVTVTKQLI